MTESAPSTSYGYNRSRPRDQTNIGNKPVQHPYDKKSTDQAQVSTDASSSTAANAVTSADSTSLSDAQVHSKSSQPVEVKDEVKILSQEKINVCPMCQKQIVTS